MVSWWYITDKKTDFNHKLIKWMNTITDFKFKGAGYSATELR